MDYGFSYKNLFYKSDELGLKNFGYSFAEDFSECLKNFVKSSNDVSADYLASVIDFNEYESSVRLNSFLSFIYRNTKNNIVIDFINNYWYKLCPIDSTDINGTITNKLKEFFCGELNNEFSLKMRPHIEFSQSVKKEFFKLRYNYNFYGKKFDERYFQLKDSYDGNEAELDDFLQSDFKLNKYSNRKLEVEERIESLKDSFIDMLNELRLYLSLDNDLVTSSLNELVSNKVDEFYNSKCVMTRFGKSDFIGVINAVRAFENDMPEIIPIVVSEIERIAEQYGIVLSNDKELSDSKGSLSNEGGHVKRI